MFGRSLFRDFDDDPFFSMGIGQRNMGIMNDPFMIDPFSMTRNPRLGIPDNRQSMQPGGQQGNELTPFNNDHFGMFGMMQGMMGMNGMMQNMHRQMGQLENDPNVHSYSSKSVYSYSNTGQGEPKVYQATTETKNAPGGIKETRRAVRDSETGTDKMAIGHHINERGHVMERSRNRRTGDEERKQEFIQMDESEAGLFNREWDERARRLHGGRQVGGDARQAMLRDRAIEPRYDDNRATRSDPTELRHRSHREHPYKHSQPHNRHGKSPKKE